MSTLNLDPQATGALPVVQVVDDRAPRHRTTELAEPNIIPAWVQLIATTIAVAALVLGFRTATTAPEPLLVFAGVAIIAAAFMIAASAFAPDIDAAIRARAAEKEAGE